MIYKEGMFFIVLLFVVFEFIRRYNSIHPTSFKQSIFNVFVPAFLVYSITFLVDYLFFGGS